jgi:hypothetical protein
MERLINIDNGGTDVGSVRKEEMLTGRRGSIEGAPNSIRYTMVSR